MKTGMKRYVEQLLEDLEVCISNATHKLSMFFDNSMCQEYFPITDEEVEGVKVSELIGIEVFFFPQLDYLNAIEAKELTGKMMRLYRAYGLNPVFSFCVPNKIKYGQLRDCLSSMVYPE